MEELDSGAAVPVVMAIGSSGWNGVETVAVSLADPFVVFVAVLAMVGTASAAVGATYPVLGNAATGEHRLPCSAYFVNLELPMCPDTSSQDKVELPTVDNAVVVLTVATVLTVVALYEVHFSIAAAATGAVVEQTVDSAVPVVAVEPVVK